MSDPKPLTPEERIELLDTIRGNLGTDAYIDKRGYNEAIEAVRKLEADAERAARPDGLRAFAEPFDNPDWSEYLDAIRKRAAGDDPTSDRSNLLRALDAEMHDSAMWARHIAEMYDEVSGGAVSKPNTRPFEVIRLYEERLNRAVDEAVADALAAERAARPDGLREAAQAVVSKLDFYIPHDGWPDRLAFAIADLRSALAATRDPAPAPALDAERLARALHAVFLMNNIDTSHVIGWEPLAEAVLRAVESGM